MGPGCDGRSRDSNFFFSASVRFNRRKSSYDLRSFVLSSGKLEGNGVSPAFIQLFNMSEKVKKGKARQFV